MSNRTRAYNNNINNNNLHGIMEYKLNNQAAGLALGMSTNCLYSPCDASYYLYLIDADSMSAL